HVVPYTTLFRSLTCGLGRIGGGRLGDVLDQGELELERDLVADEYATGIELCIPGDAPVLAVDATRTLEAGAQLAVGIGLDADELERNRHGLRHVTNRQLTGDDVGAFVHLVDGRGDEADLRVGLHVEEVCRTQVLVATLAAGVDAGGLDDDLGIRVGE